MDLKELFTEDRGVSPVIGVILMVAITVILAAVIGAFVLGLGDQASESAPQASIGFSFSDGNVTIAHDGGDNLQNDTISINIEGDEFSTEDWGGGETISTGDTIELDPNADSGDTVRVIWNNPAGGSSNTLGERQFP